LANVIVTFNVASFPVVW